MRLLLLLVLGPWISLSATAASFDYICYGRASDPNAFLGNGHALVSVSQDELRFQHYDTEGGGETLLRDYSYSRVGVVGGRGKLKDLVRFKLTKESKTYGDAIYELFVEPDLFTGGYPLRIGGNGGRLAFSGHGYKYDWNICKRN